MREQARNARASETPPVKNQSRLADHAHIAVSPALNAGQTRAAEERISAFARALAAVFDLAPQAMLVCDIEGTIIRVNAMAERLIQAPVRGSSLHVVQTIWGEMCDLRGRPLDIHRWPLMRALHGESVLATEYRVTRWDSRSFDLLCAAVPMRAPGEDTIIGALGTFTDLTHLNRRCLKLRAGAVLNERRRMAADIHDTLCQGLNAVVLQIEAGLKYFPSRLDAASHHFTVAQQSARESLAEARRSMWTLAQTPDQIGDLTRVIPAMVARILAETQVKVHFHIQPEVRKLSRFVRMQVHSIVREAVRNILKHAQASVVEIVISCDGTELRLSVQDDGKGLTPRAMIASGRFGLASMRERTHRLGGQIAIESKPGHGTRVTASIPLFPQMSGRS